MALQTSPHPHVHATHASHASHSHAVHGAGKARAGLGAEEGEGGFAAQLLKARPAAAKEAQAADAGSRADAARKPADAKDARDDKADASGKDGDKDAKDANDTKDGRAADAKAVQPPDPAALLALQQAPVAPSTTSLADRTAAAGEHDQFAADPLGALRKAAAKGKDEGRQALVAGLGVGAARPGAADAAAGASGKGAASGDITAALAKADSAVKATTEARDALAAMLPQPDPVALQAGAIGAPANAPLDAGTAAPSAPSTAPAQAMLAMPPQAPTFAPALGQQIEVWMKGGVQHAEVQLSPQELGPIRVRIEMQGDQARVQMSADVPATRDALQQAMPQLSQQLGAVGLSLAGGGVSDQPAFRQAQAQADAGGSPRAGAGGRGAGQGGALDDVAQASAARAQPRRRGLLDMYA